MIKFMKDMKAKVEIVLKAKLLTQMQRMLRQYSYFVRYWFGQLLSDTDKLEQFKKFNPDSFEEVKKLVKDFPGIKVELNKEVFIEFE